MNQNADLESLKELESQIVSRIDDFNKKRHRLKNWRNSLVIGQAIFAALTTVLVAVNIKFSFVTISIIAIVMSALSSLTGIFLSQFMFHERLIAHISTICGLRELGARVKMHKKKSLDDKKNYEISVMDVENYFEELQSILNLANSEWQKLIKKNKPKPVKKNDISVEDFHAR